MKQLSKFISLVLRHDPSKAGIELDHGGWVPVEELIDGLRASSHEVDHESFMALVNSSEKKRFTLSEDGKLIRAAQGHSITVDLGLEPAIPPDVLFHGTAEKSVDSILELGIEARDRQHVHLSADVPTAERVGQRHGRPIVFVVDALRMHTNKGQFWLAQNGVWLAGYVPAKYLKILDVQSPASDG